MNRCCRHTQLASAAPAASLPLLLLLLAACCTAANALSTAQAVAEGRDRGIAVCNTPGLSQEENERQHAYLQAQAPPDPALAGGNDRSGNATMFTIPTYFHIFRAGPKQAQGDVSNSYISAQVEQLNLFYNKHGFRFVLAGITKTTSRALYTSLIGDGGKREYPAKVKTHKGSWESLNIWVTGTLADTSFNINQVDNIAGFARFPYDPASLGAYFTQFTPVLRIDGININHNQMFRNESGKLTTTVPHETGHWLGLFHTFQGGCQKPGDGIADTPYEAKPGFGCTPRNTCTTRPGFDPIHNLMDYSSDDCQRGFTMGQGERMRRIYNMFRNPKTRRRHQYVSTKQVYQYVLGAGQAI